MANDDHRQASSPDWEAWVESQLAGSETAALRAHRTARRRRRLLIPLGTALALAAVVGAYWLTARTDPSRPPAAAPPPAATSPGASATGSASPSAAPGGGVSARGTLPSNAPSILPSLLAKPIIDPTRAFPDDLVVGASGARYKRLALQSTTDCSLAVSAEFAALFRQPGNACARATGALFTDERQASRVTVMVLSFRQAEGMGVAFGMASLDPVTYQTISIDPPEGSPVPPAEQGGGGVFKRLAVVRSVVFVNGQWADAKSLDEAGLTTQVDDLLAYVNGNVTAYEDHL